MAAVRLDKYLSDMGVCTRSEAREALRKGLVKVNKQTEKNGGLKVIAGKDAVTFDGEEIPYYEREYLLLHKPSGCITATKDEREKTVVDLLAGYHRQDLAPAGRLDKDTEGLLLLTNDGALAHRLLSPKHHVPKTYFAEVSGEITEEDRKALESGVDIGDETPTLPAECRILHTGDGKSQVELTITEGRYHQVKRMFQARGMEVLYLKRLSMGPLTLGDDLAPGAFRPLREEEVEALKNV